MRVPLPTEPNVCEYTYKSGNPQSRRKRPIPIPIRNRSNHRNRNRFCTFPKLCSNISFYNLPFRKDFHVSPFKVLHTKVERVRKRDNESLTKDNFDTFGLETRLQLVSYTY